MRIGEVQKMANEKRLIDANTLIHRVCAERDSMEINHACDIGYHNGLNMAVSMAINAPTVDAVEVVHGRWINPYMNRYGHPCHCCSVCGFKASYQDKNYCPNCGAKMDGDGNG